MRVYRLAVLAGFLAWVPGGCSDNQEEPKEPVAEDGTSEADNEAAAGGEDKIEDEKPAVDEPAPAPEAAPAPELAAAPAAPAEPAGFDGAKVTRYVTSFALNVRSGPSKESPVVRHVKRGDVVEVVINGEWAKLGPNEYIAVSRLSEAAPQAKAAKGGKKANSKKK